jgi:hypothetical protein
MGDMNESHEGSSMSILNDLARGKQQLVWLLTQFITNNQENQNNAGNNGVWGANGNNGNNGNCYPRFHQITRRSCLEAHRS